MILRWIVIAILISAAAAAAPTLLRDKRLDGNTPERILNDLKARLTKSTVDGREASGVGVEDDPDDLKAAEEAERAGKERLRALEDQSAKDEGLSPQDAEELRRLKGLPPDEPKQRTLSRTPAGAAEASEQQREADSLLEKLKGRSSAEGTENLGR
jgi:hypothetical protein